MNRTIKRLDAERETLRKELILTAQYLIRDLERAIEQLENQNYANINELGFFQGRAAGFDILCGKYEMTKRYIDMATSEWQREKELAQEQAQP